MANEPLEMSLKAIGIVRNSIPRPGRHDWEKVISEVVVNPGLKDALDGLEDFSHIMVLYWMDRVIPGPVPLKVHPRRDASLPLTGLFATRSPQRFNPLGVTTVRLLERRGNVLKVSGLDAIDGSPVVDIKPHIPGRDAVAQGRVPAWISKTE